MMMTRFKERKRLTVRFCDNVSEEGEYLDHTGPIPGLILHVGTNGSKSWLLRYRYNSKRREMGLGSYSNVSLADARDKGSNARKLLAHGDDPIEHRRRRKKDRMANETDSIDLNFIAHQIERVLADNAALRDDMRVIIAMITRLDNTRDRHETLLEDMLNEIRAIHNQVARMNERIRKLEDAPPSS
jgi:hypothetical protein